jgi:CHAT domain-containing protein
MIRFYKLRAENPKMSKGEAFRQAQLSLLRGEKEAEKIVENEKPDVKDEKNEKEGRGVKPLVADESEVKLALYEKTGKSKFSHPHYWSSFVLIGNWK